MTRAKPAPEPIETEIDPETVLREAVAQSTLNKRLDAEFNDGVVMGLSCALVIIGGVLAYVKAMKAS